MTTYFTAASPATRGQLSSSDRDGVPLTGKRMFEAIDCVIRRALDERRQPDLFPLVSLGRSLSPVSARTKSPSGARLIADKHSHEEKKDPYFASFRCRLLRQVLP